VTLTVRSTRTRFDLGPVNGMGGCSFSPTSSRPFFMLGGGGGDHLLVWFLVPSFAVANTGLNLVYHVFSRISSTINELRFLNFITADVYENLMLNYLPSLV
jgi:hypothetical protein